MAMDTRNARGGDNTRGNNRVREVMTPDPQCVQQHDSITDAARIMKDADTGVVPVVEGKKIIGLITDRDIVVRLVAEGRDPSQMKVNEAMTKSVRKVDEDAPINEVVERVLALVKEKM